MLQLCGISWRTDYALPLSRFTTDVDVSIRQRFALASIDSPPFRFGDTNSAAVAALQPALIDLEDRRIGKIRPCEATYITFTSRRECEQSHQPFYAFDQQTPSADSNLEVSHRLQVMRVGQHRTARGPSQRTRWRQIRRGHASHGFRTGTCAFAKSLTLRETIVRL